MKVLVWGHHGEIEVFDFGCIEKIEELLDNIYRDNRLEDFSGLPYDSFKCKYILDKIRILNANSDDVEDLEILKVVDVQD